MQSHPNCSGGSSQVSCHHLEESGEGGVREGGGVRDGPEEGGSLRRCSTVCSERVCAVLITVVLETSLHSLAASNQRFLGHLDQCVIHL